MVDAEPPFEQSLRAADADKRDLHRGRYDPPDIDATREESVNLVKQALKASSPFTPCSFARLQLRCRTSGRRPQIFQSTPDLGGAVVKTRLSRFRPFPQRTCLALLV